MNNSKIIISALLFTTIFTIGCNKSDSSITTNTINNEKPTSKCDALLSYIDSLPPEIMRRIPNEITLSNGEKITDGKTVTVNNIFLRPKSDRECEIYCLVNKKGFVDFNECENLKKGIDSIIKNKNINRRIEEAISLCVNKKLAKRANETIVLKNGITMTGRNTLVLNKDGKFYSPSWGKIEKSSSIWFCEMSDDGLPLEENCFEVVAEKK